MLAGRADHVRAQRHRRLARRRPSGRIGQQPVALGRPRRNVGIMTSRPMSELKDQPLHANSSEAVTNNVRVEVESQYAPEHSQPFQHEWFFHYTVRITNEGDETVQLLTPPLDHHRRHRPDRGSQRRGRRRRAAGAAAGRVVPVHVGLPAEDVDRRDARHLSDGHRGRRPLRRSRSRPSRSTSPTPFTNDRTNRRDR